ncbi:MAG: hypothetical protein OIF58_13100 [Cohaesibacter sp.]|nr:hypothetical protein [Cohaesibacter sp.]
MKSALILGNYRPSYILAKELKARGYRVICGMDGYERGAEASRHVDCLWQHPALGDGMADFQEALSGFLSNHRDIELVCPVTEPVIKAFAKGALSLPSSVTLVSMSNALVQTCLDKQKMLDLATKLDIPLAPFAATHNEQDLFAKAEEIGFPLVVRPLNAQIRLDGQKAQTIESLDQLKQSWKVWTDWDAGASDLLIQAKAAGKRDNIYFAANHGQIVRYLHAKITRTDQPDGAGLAVEGKTVSPCPKLKDFTEKLVSDLNYHGIGCAQYLVDEQSGDICFLELNSRIAGNHALPDHCGLDLSASLLDLLTTETSNKDFKQGQTGLSYGWLSGELTGLKQNYLKGLVSKRDMPAALYRAFHCFWRCDLDIAFPKQDPMPGMFTLLDSLPLIGRLTRARFQGGWQQRLFIRKEWLS